MEVFLVHKFNIFKTLYNIGNLFKHLHSGSLKLFLYKAYLLSEIFYYGLYIRIIKNLTPITQLDTYTLFINNMGTFFNYL